jgi:hypothetical protein
MKRPGFLQGETLTRLVHGAIVGIVATVILGFGFGGWTLEKTAKEMASQSARSAVVTALAPICVDNFQHAVNAATNLTELKKVSSWEQGSFVAKGGWATLPGSDPANSAVAEACAKLLSSLQ